MFLLCTIWIHFKPFNQNVLIFYSGISLKGLYFKLIVNIDYRLPINMFLLCTIHMNTFSTFLSNVLIINSGISSKGSYFVLILNTDYWLPINIIYHQLKLINSNYLFFIFKQPINLSYFFQPFNWHVLIINSGISSKGSYFVLILDTDYWSPINMFLLNY